MSQSVLRVHKLSFHAHKKAILTELSLNVGVGEFVSIIGPNGAGKSTLLKCLIRSLKGSGKIEVFDRSQEQYSQRELAQRVSYLPQSSSRFSTLTAQDFVALSRYPYLNPIRSLDKNDYEVIHLSLKRTGTESFATRTMSTLSGGERQKIYLAAALAQESPLLLLDEPTTFLDPKHQVDINLLLKQLNKENKLSFLMTTHDINSAIELSDRIVGLKNGRVLFDQSPAEVLSSGSLEELFDQTFIQVVDPKSDRVLVFPSQVAQ
jgi:iron complex transport system ATP-binding protein